MGEYRNVRGHHVHAKKAFEGHANYDPKKGFSISEHFMDQLGIEHKRVTTAQQKMFIELGKSSRPNTMVEHSRIAVEALIEGGASREQARGIVAQSLKTLKEQQVKTPTTIPWFKGQ